MSNATNKQGFSLTTAEIDVINLKEKLMHPSIGALVIFEGLVRDHADGKQVTCLEYEVYPELASVEGDRIIVDAMEKFDLIDASCVHRSGTLAIGEVAVWVGVVAAHRNEAFSACRYIIDEVKKRLPIWKRETYSDGNSGWVNCQLDKTVITPNIK